MSRPAASQQRCFERLRRHLLSDLVMLGRHTITARILTSGGGLGDWSADYRLYARQRFDPDALFAVVRQKFQQAVPPDSPFLVAIDDSILRKTGPRIPGVAYRRDPMGPPFHVNFVRALRVLQISALMPLGPGAPPRAVPIDFIHAPTAKKPSPKASPRQWEDYRSAARQANISRQARQRVHRLRGQLDADRTLWVLSDGRLTNRNFLAHLPPNTVAVGRIRRDAKLYHLPQTQPNGAGRRRIYGEPAPTPEQLRVDPQILWQTVKARVHGKPCSFRIKVLSPLRWRATSCQTLQLVVIAPLKYRLRKGSPLLYRQPAYLICTDPVADPEAILQAYLQRWDIEINFRDEKTLLGAAHPQVRNPHSVQHAPALTVAAYALLLTAASPASPGQSHSSLLPDPKWRRTRKPSRPSTQKLIQQLRRELWGSAIRQPNFSHFSSTQHSRQKSEKSIPSLANAVFYASG